MREIVFIEPSPLGTPIEVACADYPHGVAYLIEAK
jgi:hypothetical protein